MARATARAARSAYSNISLQEFAVQADQDVDGRRSPRQAPRNLRQGASRDVSQQAGAEDVSGARDAAPRSGALAGGLAPKEE
jgi:hypothetical protein